MNWKSFVAVLLTLSILDFIWMGFVTQKFYVAELSSIGRIKDGRFDVVYWAGFLVYVLLAAGVCFFVLPKLDVADAWYWAALYGAFFGLITYGIYDMTNVAILKDWGLLVSAADVAWGMVSVAVATTVGHLVRAS